MAKTIQISNSKSNSWVYNLGVLVKFKLSTIVVLTAVLAFIIASAGQGLDFATLLLLCLGGYLVTFASNALNQALEKDFDILMDRTKERPIPSGKLTISNAVLLAGIMSLIGIVLLALIHPIVALLGTISFMIYAFLYTPLKRHSTLSVAIGAIPGALPVLIGTTAAEGTVSLFGLCLFAIQFFWQFPHFWAIGYLSYDDYSKAGFKLLPEDNEGNISRSIGFGSSIYAFMILLTCIGMFTMQYLNLAEFISVLVLSIGYFILSWSFHKKFDRPSARKLMFYSFMYAPVFLLILIGL